MSFLSIKKLTGANCHLNRKKQHIFYINWGWQTDFWSYLNVFQIVYTVYSFTEKDSFILWLPSDTDFRFSGRFSRQRQVLWVLPNDWMSDKITLFLQSRLLRHTCVSRTLTICVARVDNTKVFFLLKSLFGHLILLGIKIKFIDLVTSHQLCLILKHWCRQVWMMSAVHSECRKWLVVPLVFSRHTWMKGRNKTKEISR